LITPRKLDKSLGGLNILSLEQRGFTRLLYPKFQTEISIFPFRDFNKRDGRVIRHVWTQFDNERIPRMVQALDEIFNVSASESHHNS
jgi:hypothetical protein